MYRIKKTLSAKTNAEGKKQIHIQINVSRTCRPRLKTNVHVLPDCFDEKKGEIVIPKRGKLNVAKVEDAIKAAKELDTYCNLAERVISAIDGHIEVSSEWIETVMSFYRQDKLSIKNEYNDVINWESIEKVFKEQEEAKTREEEALKKKLEVMADCEDDANSISIEHLKTIYDVISYYISHHKRARTHEPMSATRRTQFHTMSRLIQRFELFTQYTKSPIYRFDYNTITNRDLEAFRDFLQNEGDLSKRYPTIFKKILKVAPLSLLSTHEHKLDNRGGNYMAHLMKRLKGLFTWMYENDITQNQPFKRVDTGEEIYGAPIYITTEERDKIADADLSEYPIVLQEQRDIFVFQCLVGCRVTDLMRLTSANVNNGILEYVPSKTSRGSQQVKPRIPLSPRALAIIEKYKYVSKCNGKLLPFITAQRYNDRIKEVFVATGVTRIVNFRDPKTGEYKLIPISQIASSHMARRTFCGAVYKVVKDPALIGKMSGHVEGSRAFNRYRAVDDDDLREVIAKMG